MQAETAAKCTCTVKVGRIIFCPLHESAARLVAVCDELRNFLSTLKVAEKSDEIMIDEVILPYLDSIIAAAKKAQ